MDFVIWFFVFLKLFLENDALMAIAIVLSAKYGAKIIGTLILKNTSSSKSDTNITFNTPNNSTNQSYSSSEYESKPSQFREKSESEPIFNDSLQPIKGT